MVTCGSASDITPVFFGGDTARNLLRMDLSFLFSVLLRAKHGDIDVRQGCVRRCFGGRWERELEISAGLYEYQNDADSGDESQVEYAWMRKLSCKE